jgi:signal transduction histidine kinase
LLVIFTQFDTPAELYNGRSTVIWVIPILLSATIFHPRFAFLITAIICGLMVLLTPPDSQYPNPINYYVMLTLLFIAFISWLGMTIANRAIGDARHQAENARHHAANLEAILNSMADGVLVLDLNHNFLSANPVLFKMIPEEKLAEIISKLHQKNIRIQNKAFAVTTSIVPGVGSVAIFRDETRRLEAERAKDALLAVASHELRTPLAVIMNYLELIQVLIKTNKINTDEFKDYIHRSIENTHRLHQLINNILDQAQIQAGMLELKQQRFDLAALLEKHHQLLNTLIKEKNLSYTLNIAPTVPAKLNGDPDRLQQVLLNVVGNAVKFTQKGGIKVDVFLPNHETLSIKVTDSGPGISEERLPDIFEAFRRGSDYAQREKQGAGLGLSIAKEIITRMGGEILAASSPGAGSTFTISLPLEQA